MNKISICFIAQGNYHSTIHSFESTGFAIKKKEVDWIEKDAPIEYIKTVGDIEVELFVADFIRDGRTRDYFNAVATYCMPIESGIKMSKVYNDLIRMATGDYVCIIPSGLFLQENWLTELIYYYKNIAKSGVVSVVDDSSSAELISFLSTDTENMINVFLPPENFISSLVFVDRQHFYLIGAIDETVYLAGNEINQFALRCAMMGFFNYCIPSITAFFSGHSRRIEDEESDLNFATSIKEMRRARNYYLPL